MNFLAIGKYLLGISLQYWIDPSKSDRTYLAHKKTQDIIGLDTFGSQIHGSGVEIHRF